MSFEIVAIAGSSAAGIVSAAVIEKYSRGRKKVEKEKPKSITIDSAKGELSSLIFEKSLCSEAITRVYEASEKGKIDRMERDRLLLKYKQQLESINTRASQLQSVTDYSDLMDARNNLSSLLENRISAIDQKLSEISKRGVSLSVGDVQLDKITNDIGSLNATPHPSREGSKEDQLVTQQEVKSIEQLQKDILLALQRLEQVEVDRD